MSDKSIFQKIKEHGIVGSAHVVGLHLAFRINEFNFYRYQKQPIDQHLIVMESEGDLSDNAYALYDYMRANGYLNKYHVAWLVGDVEKAEKRKAEFPNTEFVQKVPLKVNTRCSEVLATCKWYIYDHCNLLETYYKRQDQKVINLWHGCGFKAPKGETQNIKTPADVNFTTGKLYDEVSQKVFSCTNRQILDIGYPRNDYLFEKNSEKQRIFWTNYELSEYMRSFLWMPTFRKSDNSLLDEQYFNSRTGLPIIETENQLDQFNHFLEEINSVCIFKVHHLQAKLRPFQKNFSNIILLHDEDIQKYGLQLYQIVPMADCLITDYSSIANDFMLLDRPIIYTIDDYEDYKNSRGFIPEDPIKYFAGECVKDYAGFTKAIKHVADGQDLYKEKRKAVLPKMHTHADGNSSKRIVEFLGL